MKDATQSGAADIPGLRMSRAEMMNAVTKGRTESINKDFAEAGSDVRLEHKPDPVTGGSDDVDLDGEPSQAAQLKADKGGEPVANVDDVPANQGDIYTFLGDEDLAKTKVKLKVDGQEQDVVVGDLLKDAQKFHAADKRLQEAALAKKRAEEEAAQILANARAEAEKLKGAAPDKPDKEESPSAADAIQQSVSLMYEGDQEAAAKKLTEAVQAEVARRLDEAKVSGATVDKAELTAEVKQQMQWESEIEQFSTNHQDVWGDPTLLGIWQANLNEAAKTANTPKEAVRKATEQFDAWRKKVSLGGEKVSVEAGGQRQQAKDAAAAAAVKSRTSVSSTTQRPEKPATPSDVVNEMKRRRGQLIA